MLREINVQYSKSQVISHRASFHEYIYLLLACDLFKMSWTETMVCLNSRNLVLARTCVCESLCTDACSRYMYKKIVHT